MALDIDRIRIGSFRGHGRPLVADKVVATDDLRRWEQVGRRRPRLIGGCLLIGSHRAGAAQVEMGVVDTGVQHRHANSRAVNARGLQPRCTDVGIRRFVSHLVLADGPDRQHVRTLGDGPQLGSVDAHDHCVVGNADSRDFLTTERQDFLQQRVLVRLDVPCEGHLLRVIHRAADVFGVLAVGDGERVARELYDHVDLAGSPFERAGDLLEVDRGRQTQLRGAAARIRVGRRQAQYRRRQYRPEERRSQEHGQLR